MGLGQRFYWMSAYAVYLDPAKPVEQSLHSYMQVRLQEWLKNGEAEGVFLAFNIGRSHWCMAYYDLLGRKLRIGNSFDKMVVSSKYTKVLVASGLTWFGLEFTVLHDLPISAQQDGHMCAYAAMSASEHLALGEPLYTHNNWRALRLRYWVYVVQEGGNKVSFVDFSRHH
jgi:hypothetical protein